MLRLEAFSAALTRPLGACMDLPNVTLVEKASEQHRQAPASTYAIEALSRLDLPADPRVITISGPPSELMHYVRPIKERSADGRLMGPGLARRLRRLHPYALLLALQNQSTASISMAFGLRGPCVNLIEGATAFVDALRILELGKDRETTLLVMSSAADRFEKRELARLEFPDLVLVEGAICLLFSPQGELGLVGATALGDASQANPEEKPASFPPGWPHAPCLEGGMCILWALASGIASERFWLSDGHGYQASFDWQSPQKP